MNLTSDQAEEILIALSHRYFQERTDKGFITDLAKSLAEDFTSQFGWQDGIWERLTNKHIKVKVQ